jgi:hypothetical protein
MTQSHTIRGLQCTARAIARPRPIARLYLSNHFPADDCPHQDDSMSRKNRTGRTSLIPGITIGHGESNGNAADTVKDAAKLQRENERLREKIRDLEDENQILHYEISNRVILETFEGEGKLRIFARQNYYDSYDEQGDDDDDGLPWSGGECLVEKSDRIVPTGPADQQQLWCDELDENNSCPVEPFISFGEALRDRALWLVGLLVLQSCSGIILARNEALLENHPVIIYFLTMLVGAGGNAGEIYTYIHIYIPHDDCIFLSVEI